VKNLLLRVNYTRTYDIQISFSEKSYSFLKQELYVVSTKSFTCILKQLRHSKRTNCSYDLVIRIN